MVSIEQVFMFFRVFLLDHCSRAASKALQSILQHNWRVAYGETVMLNIVYISYYGKGISQRLVTVV